MKTQRFYKDFNFNIFLKNHESINSLFKKS